MKILALAALAAVALVQLPSTGHSTTLFGMDSFDAGGYGQYPATNTVYGFRFSPNQDIYITAVGVFDSNKDGLARSYTAGVVASDGTILASTTIPSATAGILDGPIDPATPSLLGESAFRYASLSSPLHLVAGNSYAVAALYTAGDPDPVPGANSKTFSSLITFQGMFFNCRVSGTGCNSSPALTTLVYPTHYASSQYPIDFTFTTVVPIPGALPLFVTGLGGLAALGWRAKKKARALAA